MVETKRFSALPSQIAYGLAAILILLFSVAPLNSAVEVIFPMTLLAITFALVIRKPTTVPIFVIAAVFLLRDILFFQPLGLEAMLAVLLLKAVRGQRARLSETYLREWVGFIIAITIFFLAKLLLSAALGITWVDLTQEFISYAATIMIYPLVTAILRLQFGLNRPVAIT